MLYNFVSWCLFPRSSCCISISISINSTWWFVVVFVEFLVVIFVLILVLFNFLFCCVLVFVLYFCASCVCEVQWKFPQKLKTSSCVFSFLVLSWQCLAQLKSRHIMHCWYWGSDIPSLKFSSLFVVVFLHGWHHGALLVCPWPSSRPLLPQRRNDSRKEKLFARKPIREMLKNILFSAKLFRG